MLYVQIENGLVVNRTTFDGEKPQGWAAPGAVWVQSDTAQIGWSYDGQTFTPPEPAPDPEPLPADVHTEMNRRLGAFTHGGVGYQLDDASLTRITAMGADANFAIAAGAQPGDLRWADPGTDFGWIAADNTITPMDAPAMAAFANAAKLWVLRHTFAARALKDTPGGIPADFATNEAYWPAAA